MAIAEASALPPPALPLPPRQQQHAQQLPRLIIVHHTLPWSFSPKPASPASEQQLSDTLVVDTPKSPRLRSRSFGNLHSRKGNSSLHCIRPSICNHLAECSIGDAEEDTRKTDWHLEERLNHPALQASEARGVSERIFVGWPGHCLDDANCEVDELAEDTKEALRRLYLPRGGIPVFLSSTVAHNAFNGYYRTLLWPLFHYAIKELPFLDAINQNRLWLDYEAVNRAYFDAVVGVYRPGDIESRELLAGMLGAKVIGFQDYSYVRHCISSCARVLGVEHTLSGMEFAGQPVFLTVLPMGIDRCRVERELGSEAVIERIAALRERHGTRQLLVGIDKSEQARGVRHKLEGMRLLFSKYPEWINKVVLIQVLTPDVLVDGKTEARVAELAASINCEYGSIEYTPVYLLTQLVQPNEYYSLLSVADTLLHTPERDANPLVTHDFVLCQAAAGRRGPLVLSDFTATSRTIFADAIVVNPWDHDALARAIHAALLLDDDERTRRHQTMLEKVKYGDAQRWADSLLYDLQFRRDYDAASSFTPIIDSVSFKGSYAQARRRFFFLDYDGTLAGIVRIPSAAVPTPEALAMLRALTQDERNTVYIVSGRDRATLDAWLGKIPRLGFSAEHGCFLRGVNQAEWTAVEACTDDSWKEVVLPVLEYFTERTVGSFIEHKSASLVWHYRLADPDFGSFQAKECLAHLESVTRSIAGVEVISGKKNLEVRPSGTNKGELIRQLLQAGPSNGEGGSIDWVFSAGDDRTDEDMFKAVNQLVGSSDGNANTTGVITTTVVEVDASRGEGRHERTFVTCVVGPASKRSCARVRVESPMQLVALLASLSSHYPPSQ